MIKAQIVGDSKSPQGHRITSMLITMPRIILAELNTHRMTSRNSASSRAIPFEKMVKSVQENPFIPIAWQKDHKGMQGSEYFQDLVDYTKAVNSDYQIGTTIELETQWLNARDAAIEQAMVLSEIGLTKQLCNRLLEPFMWHTVLITATEWENFFALRCPQYTHSYYPNIVFKSWKQLTNKLWEDGNMKQDIRFHSEQADLQEYTILQRLQCNQGQAEIHMMALAEAMWDAMNESVPKELQDGDWHIVFDDKIDELVASTGEQIYEPLARVKVATGMGARTSYTVVGDEKEVSCKTLINIHDKMAVAVPFHASPFEHCARVMTDKEYYDSSINIPASINAPNLHTNFSNYGWCRNFRGFIQYRAILENNK